MHETALSADDFVGFYEAVHGDPPWDWQQRLAAEVLAAADAQGDRKRLWPDVIDAPTGAGKTSVADIAVFALAARPGVFPRRIVWVINRRIVVDEVYEHVERINDRLREAETGPERAVADSLRAMAGPGGGDLIGMSALRGGLVLADDWARHPPDRPWVAVSTIDQYGSRLLHRGYGVSPRTRSVHAGLAGNDCLVILDEMHTSGPLHDTIRGVRDADERHAGPDRVRLPRRFEVVRMSATPGAVGPDCKTFTLSKAERAQPGLRQRLRSEIDAKLVPAKGVKGAQAGYRENAAAIAAGREHTAKAALGALAELDETLAVEVVGVVLNTVAAAQEVHRRAEEAGYTAHLLTGRMRPLDKADAVASITHAAHTRERTRDGRAAGTKPLVVVSTQSIEIGADFDFDAMITECAPADSLRQRFGRLDRKGDYTKRSDGQNPRAWIIEDKADPIYRRVNEAGKTVSIAAASWKWLKDRADRNKLVIGPGFWGEASDDLTAARPAAPQVQQTHLEAWGRTLQTPDSDPPVGDFLHGIGSSVSSEVSICWREDHLPQALKLTPPRAAEMLAVPIRAARRWLAAQTAAADTAPVGDVDAADTAPAPPGERDEAASGGCVRLKEGWKPVDVDKTSEIKPGDIVLVKPSAGGIRAGTWDPSAAAGPGGGPEDLGDRAQDDYGRPSLRLHPRHMARYMPEGRRPTLSAPGADDIDPVAEIEAALSEIAEHADPDRGGWAAKTARMLLTAAAEGQLRADRAGGPGGGYWVVSARTAAGQRAGFGGFGGYDDSESLTGDGTDLLRHGEQVGEIAARRMCQLGMPEAAQDAAAAAGQFHDIGKADPEWQYAITGDPAARLPGWVPLAKSPPGARGSALPPVRHEDISVKLAKRLAEADPEHAEELAGDWDLVLHLIGSHHGYGRPHPKLPADPNPRPVWHVTADGRLLECRTDGLCDGEFAAESSERFNRLTRRYGYYGLAWLEAVVRMADWEASAGPLREGAA